MSDKIKSCGDFGGVNLDGTPCKRASHGGRCPHHDGEGQPSYKDYVPREADRRFVETGAMVGMRQEDLCRVLGISVYLLRKHYSGELENAYMKANAKVAQTLFQMATSGKNTAATIFWMKTRMRWSEAKGNEETRPSVVVDVTPSKDDEAQAILDEIDKRIAAAGGGGKIIKMK